MRDKNEGEERLKEEGGKDEERRRLGRRKRFGVKGEMKERES